MIVVHIIVLNQVEMKDRIGSTVVQEIALLNKRIVLCLHISGLWNGYRFFK